MQTFSKILARFYDILNCFSLTFLTFYNLPPPPLGSEFTFSFAFLFAFFNKFSYHPDDFFVTIYFSYFMIFLFCQHRRPFSTKMVSKYHHILSAHKGSMLKDSICFVFLFLFLTI